MNDYITLQVADTRFAIIGWRLLVLDNLGRMRPGRLGIVLYQALRPLWKICRSLLFWRLQGKSNDSH